MAIDDYWFKNAVIYCLNVATYMDFNGDGIGDFEGLSRRLDYLHGLGVTCIWLQHGCGSLSRGAQGRGRQAGEGFRAAPGDAAVPAMARPRCHPARRGEC